MSRAPVALILIIALCGCGPRGPVDEPPAEGACVTDDDCGAADECRDGVCAPYEGQLDDPCYDDMDCALELHCTGGVCQKDEP